MNDVIVRFLDMPTTIKGMTVLDEEGYYNVYLNPRLASNMQNETLEHELRHIKEGHFYDDAMDIKEKEQNHENKEQLNGEENKLH